MTCGVFAVLADDDLESLCRLMDGWRVRHAPVVDEHNVLIGLVSERDLLRNTLLGHPGAPAEAITAELRARPVSGVMQPWPVVAHPEERIDAVAGRMYGAGIECLPVVDEATRLVGVITEADFVRWFAEQAEGRPAA
jgi:CBS domain-containing protein